MTDGYSAIYQYYDSFTGNVDYRRRADFIAQTFKQYREPEIVLDAGCGTGTLTSLLKNRGYDMIGVDSSPEMLSVAMEKMPGQLLLCQDLTELDLYGTVQGAVCMQDTLNHLPDIASVNKAISRISLFMEPGCIFIFDLNTEYKHRYLLGDNSYVYEDEDAMLVWQNSTDPDLKVTMNLDLFVQLDDGTYERESGTIEEILIDNASLSDCLSAAGLELIEAFDGDTLDEICETTQRILYVTRKQ